MQSRPTNRLAKKMASYARRHSWTETARKFQITDPTGKPSRQLAQRIAVGYEPKKPDTRSRCGLPVKITLPHPVTINQLLKLPISDMPPEILRLAFDNREEMS
jgi:hypothetical protein